MKFSKKIITALTLASLTFGVLTSCKPESDQPGNNSEAGEGSHNTGTDCLLCHKIGGNGEGFFTVAGTVYDSLQKTIVTGATVYLYSGANSTGTLLATIPTDGSGNFYTSKKIDFSTDVYVSAKSSNGAIKEMQGKIKAGNCNSCHGSTTDVIWVK